jgi:hypothetical protein
MLGADTRSLHTPVEAAAAREAAAAWGMAKLAV